MATTLVTLDQVAILSEIDIGAPADRVFQGICDAETVRRQQAEFDVFEMDLRVAGKWRLHLRMPKPYGGVGRIRHDGEVLEIDPPRPLVYTWFAYTWFADFHTDPKHRSMVRWELTPTNSGTHEKVTDSGLITEPAARADDAVGWPGVLQEIKTFAESECGEHQ